MGVLIIGNTQICFQDSDLLFLLIDRNITKGPLRTSIAMKGLAAVQGYDINSLHPAMPRKSNAAI